MLKEDRPLFSYTESKTLLSALPLADTARAVVLIPLKTVGVLVGKLFLIYENEREFSEDERRILISMVDFTGNALYRAKILDTLEQHVQNRTQDLTTLYGIANIISQAMDLPSTFAKSLGIIQEALGALAGVIHLVNEETHRLEIQTAIGFLNDDPGGDFPIYHQVLEDDNPVLVSDLTSVSTPVPRSQDARQFQSFISAPVRGHAGVLGIISLFSISAASFNFENLSLLTSVADHLSIAIENARLRQRAEDAIVIEERQRLARELHDSISQLLYSQLLFADASQKALGSAELELLPGYLNRLAEVSHQAFKEMRLMIYSLRPKILESVGLVGALQQRLNTVEKRAGLQTTLSADDGITLPANIEDGLYRIAQEALNNTLKHAAARRVALKIKREADGVTLEVEDDGVGFDRTCVI